MYQFYVVMLKRKGGKVYADLHKTTKRIYLDRDEALQDWVAMGILTPHFHVVELFAVTGVGDVYLIDKDGA